MLRFRSKTLTQAAFSHLRSRLSAYSGLPVPVHQERQTPFRQGFCRAPGCGALFFVCPSCERGQAYCSSECRKLARRLQLRQANRRHQQSEEGRLDHITATDKAPTACASPHFA